MHNNLVVILLAAGALYAQDVQTPPAPTGSISGVVQFEGTGKPVEGGFVVIDPGNKNTKTDAQGKYAQHDLAPGTYRIRVDSMNAASVSKAVSLLAGQDLTVDFHLPAPGSITGRIVDENKEPVPDIRVSLVAREYQFGELHYVYTGVTTSNDKGEYRLAPVAPGRGYLVVAEKRAPLHAISDAPADPRLRKRVPVPTYYDGADSPEGGQVLVLRSGEQREGVDIRMLRSPSYCLEGVLEGANGPRQMYFAIGERQPAFGMSGAGGTAGMPPGGRTGTDGKIRICDLHPGDYELTAFALDGNESVSVFGSTSVSITDGDVGKVALIPAPHLTVPGEVVWDGKAPDKPVQAKLGLWLMPVARPFFKHEPDGLFPKTAIPGQFSLPNLLMDSYNLRLLGVPDDLYVKDITYSGQSILHKPLNVGSAIGKATLRIVVATDGGVVAGKVTDKDGNPIPDASVTVMPANAESEAILAAALVSEPADQNGAWSTKRLAPGKYYIVASTAPFDMTPESIGRLWQMHTKAQEVELGPGATVQMTLVPMPED
jgi:hypothetical protein